MPARISRRCITVTSFGDCGTIVPSLFNMSRKTRLGCVAGVSSPATMPTPVTRSIASFGRTQSLRPAKLMATATKTKTSALITNMSSNLDAHDFLDHCVSNNLETNCSARQIMPNLVFEEELGVVGIDVEHHH